MSVSLSFLGVILVWSTTPLAIKWSGEGVGPLFGAAMRMGGGAVVALAVLLLLGRRLPLGRRALQTYLAAAVSLYGNMACVYWGAQVIPSGLVAVVFGMMPVVTSIMAAVVLGERSLTPVRITGMVLGLAGLGLIFYQQLHVGGDAWLGMAAVFAGMTLHAASTVWVKRVGQGLSGMSVATGGLLMSLPFYAITWWLTGADWPEAVSWQSGLSIAYLAIFGSVLGFMWYFQALRHVEASKMALIPLITPVAALCLGVLFNDETFSSRVVLGTLVVLAGLGIYQWPAIHEHHRARRQTVTGERGEDR